MKLSIIIVSFNTSSLLKNCLNAIKKAIISTKLLHDMEIIVVDNASKDKSVEMVKTDYPFVRLIENKSNTGFSEANNEGIRISKGENILLLNTDTIVEKNLFDTLLTAIEKDKKIGVVGPKIINSDGTIQQSLGYFPNLLKIFFWMTFLDDLPIFSYLLRPYHIKDSKYYNNIFYPDWVTGACLLVRRKAIQAAGMLDSKIFMYGEEVEWCYRIKQANFKVLYTPYTKVKHFKGGSGVGDISGIVEEFKSLTYFYVKHKTRAELILLKILIKLGILLRFIIFGIILCNPKRRTIYAKAFEMVR